MHLKNLVKASFAIALSFFVIQVKAQNTANNNHKPADTSSVSFGYGLQPAKSVTGAVTVLPAENFNQGAIFNPAGQLAGKVAGLTVTQPGGDPNQTTSLSIRGQASVLVNTSPLFVIDGVILDDATQFQNIPPEDIASYTVLKDASATAIYGVRGANGVIIVTTKKGVAGKPVLSYSGLVGEGMQSKYYDLLTPNEYRAAIGPNSASTYDKGANTDWQKAIGRTAFEQRHYVSLSGGSNSVNYIASANYQNQQGIIQNNGKEQLGLRFSGEAKVIGDKLDIKAGIQYINTTRKYVNYNNFGYVFNAPPTYPVKNSDGSYYTFSDFDEANPVEHINQEVLGGKEHLTLINGSIDYSIIHDLKIGVLASADINKMDANGFIPAFPAEGNFSFSGTANENDHLYNGNVHINYDKTFGKSTVNLMAAYEYNDHYYSNNYVESSSRAAYMEEYKLTSFFARAAYSYDNLFYATATLRRESSAIFAANDQPGVLPSVSLAYRFKKDILANVDWISDIKLRAGYGVTGNSTNRYSVPGLQWEETHGANIGLDFSLFNGLVSGDVNYFNNQPKNLLLPYSAPSPPFVPGTMLTTGGSIVNKGLEIALSGRIISGHKLNWTAYGQITFASTTIDDLSGQYTYNGQTYTLAASQVPEGYAEGRGLSSSPITFFKTGYSPYVFYLPHYTGADAQGNQTFNGQTIQQNPAPQGYYIDPSPKFNYGITNSFDYGNWNLTFALRGVYGQKVFDNTRLDVETITRLPGNNVTKEALTNGIKDAPVASDLWLEGASFLRMDNMTLAYSFKNLSFASTLRVFVAANNLFVITGYKGLDPEVQTTNGPGGNLLFGGNLNGSMNQAYIDANYAGQAYYPAVRTFSLGVNVSLK